MGTQNLIHTSAMQGDLHRTKAVLESRLQNQCDLVSYRASRNRLDRIIFELRRFAGDWGICRQLLRNGILVHWELAEKAVFDLSRLNSVARKQTLLSIVD